MSTDTTTSLWCRWCGHPVAVDSTSADPVTRLEARAVHTSTRQEQCENGRHIAAPTDSPSLCAHDPDPDSAYTSAGLKAVLARDLDVPVEAKCRVCQQWIRREQRAAAGPDPAWHLKYPERV